MATRLKNRSKYGAVPTELDGIRFHSAKEARRYGELKLLLKAGKIFRLELQPRFRLCAWTTKQEAPLPALGDYVADFRYCTTPGCHCANGCVIEDVKGFSTPLYKWKRRHTEAQYGIQIREI